MRQQTFKAFAQIFQLALLVRLEIPFVDRYHHSAALAFGKVSNTQILLFERDFSIEQNNHHFGEFDGTQTIAHAQLFQLFLNFRLFTHTSSVKNPHRDAVPDGAQRYRIAGNPRFGTSQQAIFAHDLVNQSRFAGVRTPDDGNLKRFCVSRHGHWRVFVTQLGFFFGQIHVSLGRIGLCTLCKTVRDRHQMGVEIVQPFAVFGRHTNGFAQPKAIRLDHTGVGGFALGLIGSKNDMRGFLAQDVGKDQIGRRNPDAGVDHEQADICHIDSTFGQTAHAPLQTVVGDFFKSGGVYNCESQVGKPRRPFAQIARHTGLIIDQRQFFTDKTVEQRGFPNVGTAHNGEGEGHGTAPKTRSSLPLSLFAA